MAICLMADPFLRIRASGYGGSGYFNPHTGEKVIGVTTALGAINIPALIDWHVQHTAAWAVANVDQLLRKDFEQGISFLRYYSRRMKPSEFDDPEIDIFNYSYGVLDDLANMGTMIHEYAEAQITDGFGPDLFREEHFQMAEVFDEWLDSVELTDIRSEGTVFGRTESGSGFGGTADLVCTLNGETWMIDFKSSRAIHDQHIAQIAAYGKADYFSREVAKGTEGAVEYKGKSFVKAEFPTIQRYGVLQIRPLDWDHLGNEIPPFAKLHQISQAEIDAGWGLFQGAVAVREGQKAVKDATKERLEWEDD